MTEHIDSLIEMALDFSEFDVRDPHDPKFHAAIVGQLVTVYIPITTDKFWEAVTKGVQTSGLHPRSDWKTADIFTTQNEAVQKANHTAWEMNGQNYEGPHHGLVLVAEKKVLNPFKGKSPEAALAFRAGVIKGPLIDGFIRPQDIVSVNYPAKENSWDTPIREFVANAKYGHFEPAIPGQKATGLKFGRATPPAWQFIILRYVQDLLNYSSNYFDYLTGDTQNDLTTVVVREATKLGWGHFFNWTGREFMEWVYSILPPSRDAEDTGNTKEEDIENVMSATSHEGTNRPFYNLINKYKDELGYEVRSGKKPAPNLSR